MGWHDPGYSTKIPPELVRLTDVEYPISKKNVPAILAIRDIVWEDRHGKPCRMRLSLEKAGYLVEPPFEGRDTTVL